MPVHNGERYVAEAIESVLAQTHRDLELVAIDDGSTDGTWAILRGFAARDPRVRAFTQANADQPATLNRGLELAGYEWVAIHDHDDVSLPERLERQLRFLRDHPAVRVLGTYATEIDAAGRDMGSLPFGPASMDEFRRTRAGDHLLTPVHPSVVLHRPTVLALGGYDPAFGPAADAELWSRVADDHPVLVLPEMLLRYRVHGGSMSFTRLFHQRQLLRWACRRQRARRSGLRIPTFVEHLAWERGPLAMRQANLRRLDWAFFASRRARLAMMAGRRLETGLYLGTTIILEPIGTTRRAMAHAQRTRLPQIICDAK